MPQLKRFLLLAEPSNQTFLNDRALTSALAEKTSTSATAVKLKELRLAWPGTYRIKFGLRQGVIGASPGNRLVNAQIYRNGAAVGVLRQLTTSSVGVPTIYIEDVPFVGYGDLCQVYGYISTSIDPTDAVGVIGFTPFGEPAPRMATYPLLGGVNV